MQENQGINNPVQTALTTVPRNQNAEVQVDQDPSNHDTPMVPHQNLRIQSENFRNIVRHQPNINLPDQSSAASSPSPIPSIPPGFQIIHRRRPIGCVRTTPRPQLIKKEFPAKPAHQFEP